MAMNLFVPIRRRRSSTWRLALLMLATGGSVRHPQWVVEEAALFEGGVNVCVSPRSSVVAAAKLRGGDPSQRNPGTTDISSVTTMARELLRAPPQRKREVKGEACAAAPCWPDARGKGAARMAYLIVVHDARTLDDALVLYRSIRTANSIVLLHMDTKFPHAMASLHEHRLYSESKTCGCGSVFHADSVHSSEWGQWSMNFPTLWALELLANDEKFKDRWDVFVNLSGDTLPTLAPHRVEEMFGENGPLFGTNFVTSRSSETGLLPTPVSMFPPRFHKRGHYGAAPRLTFSDARGTTVHHNVTVEIHFGSQWMALTKEFSKYVSDGLKDPTSLPHALRAWLIHSDKLMSDETFFPTLLANAPPFNGTLPVSAADGSLEGPLRGRLFHLRYERMDEHMPRAFGFYPGEQRYAIPPGVNVTERPWGPYFLGAYDLANIKASGALYVRKVSALVEPSLTRVLPVDDLFRLPDIGWPENAVTLTEVPDWEKTKAKLIAKAKQSRQLEEEDYNNEEDSKDDEEEEL